MLVVAVVVLCLGWKPAIGCSISGESSSIQKYDGYRVRTSIDFSFFPPFSVFFVPGSPARTPEDIRFEDCTIVVLTLQLYCGVSIY